MLDNHSDTFVMVEDGSGENYFCPLDIVNDVSSPNSDDLSDCVGEDVVGRYAGNIKIKST
ncbi:MAG: hypothetical protein PVF37_11620 [Desulfobacterales bacterium]